MFSTAAVSTRYDCVTIVQKFTECALEKDKSKRGSISLAQAAPPLVANWDHEKNGDITPDSISFGSQKRAWWKCHVCGEGWQAVIGSVYLNAKRINFSGGLGCPYCSGRQASKLNNLGIKNPSLSAEWNVEKNGNLTPFDIAAKSHRNVWWTCPDGHTYEASPSTRVGNGGKGCPVCAGKVVVPETSLATNFPDLAMQWHPTKNGKLTPDKVSTGSNRKVWWRCNKGHVWQAIVNDRTNKNYGCRICAGRSTSLFEMRLFTELRTIFSDVRWRSKVSGFEVDLLLPSIDIGIEADGSYWHREKVESDLNKNKLAKDAGLKLIRLREKPLRNLSPSDIEYSSQYGELKVIHQLLDRILEMDDTPATRAAISTYKAKGRLVADSYFRKLAANLPAPPFENSLAKVNPELAKEWNYEKNAPLTPEMFLPKSKRKVWWRCSAKGHEYSAGIGDRADGNGCPYCRGLKVAPENSLATLFPKVAAGWDMERNDGLTPHDVTKASNKEIWWKCEKCGAAWKATVDRRTLRKSGCPNCSWNRVTESNNLAVKRPDIAESWDFSMNGDLSPHDVSMTSQKRVWWKCSDCGESWQAPPSRLCAGHGCPFCSGNRVGTTNNLAHLHPALAATWATDLNAGVTPSDIVAGTPKKFWWKCNVCGEVWKASPASRVRGTNCPYCAGRKVGNFNNLAYKKPDIAKTWAISLNGDLTPASVTLGSHKKVWWRCLVCSGEWMATVKDRAGKGSGCPFCAKEMKKNK